MRVTIVTEGKENVNEEEENVQLISVKRSY
jgi:hypothetical protein